MAKYYIGQMTWDDLAQDVSIMSTNMRDTVENWLRKYNQWQTFRAGRDNATIAAALTAISGATITDTMVGEMDAAYAAAKALHDQISNQSVVQADHLFSLRKFYRSG